MLRVTRVLSRLPALRLARTITYDSVYENSIENPKGFWGSQAMNISWSRKPTRILDDDDKFSRWFTDGELNMSYNAIDRHVERGMKNDTAIIYDSPVTKSARTLTFGDLQLHVSQCAGALANLGIGKGDYVVLYMPMVPETVITMLACARLGAIHSVVFGGFAAHELAVRIDDIKPKAVIYASCGVEGSKIIPYQPMVDQALEKTKHQPDVRVVLQRHELKVTLRPKEVDWMQAVSSASSHAPVNVKATDPLYVLYTSGTTGKPKGVVRDTGGYAVALRWTMEKMFDMDKKDVFWAASDVGWVVGHSFTVYGPLLNGCATVLYEGKPVGTPDAGAFWRVISQHRVKSLYTAPTAIRAIKKEDPEGKLIKKYDMKSLESIYLAGERCDPDTVNWASKMLNVPVIDNWWQTETGWPVTGICRNKDGDKQKIIVGAAGKPLPGWNIKVLNDEGHEVEAGEQGTITCKLPLPPGCFPTLHNDHERYKSTYFSTYDGYYNSFDAGKKDEDGYVHVMTRIDDVINVAGHRLSTGNMEEILSNHPSVAECAVIGIPDELKGQLPVGFVVLKSGVTKPFAEIQKEIASAVRSELGALACYKITLVVPKLPKTRSGKILRATMRKIAAGDKFVTPPTIEDVSSLNDVSNALKQANLLK